MTEAEWLTSEDYTVMLRFVHTRTTVRQARLCMAGCCRQWAHQFSDARIPRIIDTAECCADSADAEQALDAYSKWWHFSREAQLPNSGRWERLGNALADAHQKLDECRADETWDGSRYRTPNAAMAHALYMALREDPLETYVGGEGDAVFYCTRLIDHAGVLLLRNR